MKRISRNAPKEPLIIDNRQPKPQVVESDIPVRTVVFVEVGDMERARVNMLLTQINEQYTKGGVHYIIPVRHGKISSDIIFEGEFIELVNKLCEIKDGNIVMRDGAQECTVVRQQI